MVPDMAPKGPRDEHRGDRRDDRHLNRLLRKLIHRLNRNRAPQGAERDGTDGAFDPAMPGVRRATPNPLLDDERSQPSGTLPGGWRSTAIVLVCSVVLLAAVLALAGRLLEPVATPVAQPTPTEHPMYRLDQTIRLDKLTVLVHDFTDMNDRSRLHLLIVNFDQQALPGGVEVSDGHGNEAEIIPASEHLPPQVGPASDDRCEQTVPGAIENLEAAPDS